MGKDELKEMGTSGWAKLNAAIERGNKNEALSLANRLRDGSQKLLDVELNLIDLLFDTLAKSTNEESVYQVLRTFYNRYLRHLRKEVPGKSQSDAEERLKALVDILTMSHGVDIDIEEDQEKFSIKVPCDTGGRIIARGQYGKTSKGYPWSNMQKDFCYYCAHCVVSWEMMPIEEYGYPSWVISAPRKPGEPCTLLLYKDPKSIPEKYYKLVGMEKKRV